MDGQGDPEGRALAQRRLDRDRPALHFDHALGDRQTQPGAALLTRIRIVDLLELAEDPLLVGVGNARPGIAHLEDELAAIGRAADLDLALVGELDRVADEVQQHLREPARVAVTLWHIRLQRGAELYPLRGGERLSRGDDAPP